VHPRGGTVARLECHEHVDRAAHRRPQRVARDDPQRPRARWDRAVETGATARRHVPVDDERAAHDGYCDHTLFGGTRREGAGRQLGPVYGTRRDVVVPDRRPERQIIGGDGDGPERAERVRAPVERGEVGGDESRRGDRDGDGADPQDHGAR